jgi:hypothetical protein
LISSSLSCWFNEDTFGSEELGENALYSLDVIAVGRMCDKSSRLPMLEGLCLECNVVVAWVLLVSFPSDVLDVFAPAPPTVFAAASFIVLSTPPAKPIFIKAATFSALITSLGSGISGAAPCMYDAAPRKVKKSATLRAFFAGIMSSMVGT